MEGYYRDPIEDLSDEEFQHLINNPIINWRLAETTADYAKDNTIQTQNILNRLGRNSNEYMV